MPIIEPSSPLRLLRAGYAPDDWVAVFLKSYATGDTCQRVAAISQVSRPEFLAWLRSDVAILPVMTIRTPPAAKCDPERAEFRPRTLYELSRLTRFVNMLGFPAVALPVGFDDRGLPVALQIVGRPGADRALLALAAAVQQRSDWHGRVPAAIAGLAQEDP